jgi:proteasome lid subunit RPN8/RPN11
MVRTFRYILDLSRAKSGESLGRFEASVDFAPVAEWGRFTALRRWADPEAAANAEIGIEPAWHTTAGAPYVGGLRVSARAEALPAISADIPKSLFKASAVKISDTLLAEKKLEPGELFNYAVLAFPVTDEQGNPSANGLELEDVPVPATLLPGSLEEELGRSIAFGDLYPDLVPVFFPRQVLDEALAMTEQAGNAEVGAALIGAMHKDVDSGQLYLKVTAQIPARHAVSESMKLSFTAETWSAVQAALDLRGRREQLVGFFHNHPARFWCNKDCSPEARQDCPFNTPFFSQADCDLHRVVFAQAHCIALLVTNAFSGMKLSLYGWDRAMIIQRGFHITQPDTAQPLPLVPAASIIGSDPHETSCHP